MRALLALLFVVACANAQAFGSTCLDKVDKAMSDEMDANSWTSHGVDTLDEGATNEFVANPHDWSNTLEDRDIVEIEQYIVADKYEFYHFTGTGDYSGGFQLLLVVDPATCLETDRFLTYEE